MEYTVRPIRPEDADQERAFVNGLSERSKYLRFMYTLREITPQMVERFTQIDEEHEAALIAIVKTDQGDRQVGVARFAEFPDDNGCEFAIVISDEWQGHGIATRLLTDLIEIARQRGLETMEGLVLRENTDMLRLTTRLGFTQHRYPEDLQLVIVRLAL